MAYMTVSLSAGSYDPETNSTPVSATVSITWNTSESYNQMNQYGTLSIGSNYSTTFGTNFNSSRTESGTQILGSGSTTIEHNSNGDPVQVTASASGAGYSASNTITLPGKTSSGGSDGDDGDDSGDSGGTGSGSVLSVMYLNVSILQGEHTTIRAVVVKNAQGGTEVGYVLKHGDVLEFEIATNTSTPTEYPVIQISYEVDDGYVIDKHTINGGTFDSGCRWVCSSLRQTLEIQTSARMLEKILIDNGSSFEEYNCYIDNGTSWDAYIPYFTVEKHYSWNGLFEATVNTTDSGLYLREGNSANYTDLALMPSGTELAIEDIAIGEDGTTVWAKTTYESKTGWANAEYLNFTIYGVINNESGTSLYLTPELTSNTLHNFEYEQEIVITTDSNNPALVVGDNLIWGNVSIENTDGTSIVGYVTIEDIDFMTERTTLEWVKMEI